MDKSSSLGCPCHPKKYPRGTSIKVGDAPEAPLLHRQKSGHLSRHYIFIASCTMRFSWSVFTFVLSFVLFASINGWTPTNLFWRRCTCFSFAKNTPFFTLIVQRVFSFSRTTFSFCFFCLDFCSDLILSLHQGVFGPLVYVVFIKRVVLKRFEWCWNREKVSCKKVVQKEACLDCGLDFFMP
jgi:hypothetical protein